MWWPTFPPTFPPVVEEVLEEVEVWREGWCSRGKIMVYEDGCEERSMRGGERRRLAQGDAGGGVGWLEQFVVPVGGYFVIDGGGGYFVIDGSAVPGSL